MKRKIKIKKTNKEYRMEYRHEVCRCDVAGVAYGDYQKMNLKVGDKLDLFGEPKNKYDRKAISIRRGAHRLGYIPRKEDYQDMLWALHSSGHRLKAFIHTINKNNPTWQMFVVSICSNTPTENSSLIRF